VKETNGDPVSQSPTAAAEAAQASNSNLSAPVSDACVDDSCGVERKTAAIFAECQHKTLDNPDKVGIPGTSCGAKEDQGNATFCSDIVPNSCATLTDCGSPAQYASFVNTRGPSCASDTTSDLCTDVRGEWITIFGVWVGGIEFNIGDPTKINVVDCVVSYGNVTVPSERVDDTCCRPRNV